MKKGDIPETIVLWNLLFHPIHPTGATMCKATEQIMMFSICRSIHKFLSHLAPDYRAMDATALWKRPQEDAKMTWVLIACGHADSAV